MLLKKRYLIVSAAFLLLSSVSNAAVVNFQFTGTVTDGGTLAASGDQITGAFSYDTETLPSVTSNHYAYYQQLPAPFTLSASVAGHALVTNFGISIWDNQGSNVGDMIIIFTSPEAVNGNPYPNGDLGFSLASAGRNTGVWADTSLPSSFDVSAFDASPSMNNGWFRIDVSPNAVPLRFSVNSITAVPIPSAFLLFISGLLVMSGRILKYNVKA